MREKSIQNNNNQDLLRRLRRIEGQVKGLQRMIEDEKSCVDVLTQVAAIRAAINKVGGMILESHSRKCIKDAVSSENNEKVMEELIDTVQKFLKFVD